MHQQRVTKCPPELIAGYYWYGPKKCSAGKIPRWVTTLCSIQPSTPSDTTAGNTPESEHVDLDILESATDIFDEQITHNDKTADPIVVDNGFDPSIIDDFDEVKSDVLESTGLPATRQRITQPCPYNLRNTINLPKKYQ